MKSKRIESIDILRGVIMVIMALDHTRDFFHIGSFKVDPTDLSQTSPYLFFTRFITHYCAPIFVFLAGSAAFLYGQNKTKKELSLFLITRGLWLMICEVTIVKLLWSFSFSYDFVMLQVIWAIGSCMVILSAFIYIPFKYLLGFGLLMLFGHNLLDTLTQNDKNFSSIIWYMLHQQNFVEFSPNFRVGFFYPILPWLGVLILGFNFGRLYQIDFNFLKRMKYLKIIGLSSIILFIIIRLINIYGDPNPWKYQKDNLFTFLSFINVEKYPPSLDYTLITIGPGILFLSFIEKYKNKITDFFLVFGRVPFFYYLMHLLFIHGISSTTWYIITGSTNKKSSEFTGFHLGAVYLFWIGIVLLLYPFCLKYMKFKTENKDKKWLTYL